MIGTTIGPYHVVETLGEGGMGRVYRARDTRLNRQVALKVLPDHFAADPDRIARFAREAQMIAALHHPNIAAVYGFEESDGIRALVMELVEGPTLFEKISQGALRLDEALALASQIAGALESAHERGIVHRDLKPANLKLTADGTVKVLDFGLAKALDVAGGGVSEVGSTAAPTIGATEAGVILGTTAYMSPEQTRGKPVDRRADIWAFGCVLYEMLTGTPAFEGDTTSDTLVAVLTRQPDLTVLPGDTPPAIRTLLTRCLDKDPKQRLRDIGEARIAIEATQAGTNSGSMAGTTDDAGRSEARAAAAPALRRSWLAAVAWAVAGMLIMALGIALWQMQRPDPPSPRTVRFEIATATDDTLSTTGYPAVAISPDGSHLAYVVEGKGLHIRALDRLEPTWLRGTENAAHPFFSPDGQWVGFGAGGKLLRVPVSGGPPLAIADTARFFGGATWGPDESVIASLGSSTGLVRIPLTGGAATPVTTLDQSRKERTHRWPHLLPDGKTVLFSIGTTDSPDYYDAGEIAAVNLETGSRKIVFVGASLARYAPPGYLILARQGSLAAAPFDLDRVEVTGPAVPVETGVGGVSTTGAAHFAVAGNGTLVFIPGTSPGERALVWRDLLGNAQPLPTPAGDYFDPSLSPDGTRLAIVVRAQSEYDIWLYDLAQDTMTRFTFGGINRAPVWSPDSRRIVFYSAGADQPGVYVKGSDGRTQPEFLFPMTEMREYPNAWSPDGRAVTLDALGGAPTHTDVVQFVFEKRSKEPLLRSRFQEHLSSFSPDGNWLAYTSNESGEAQVYVQPYPGAGGRWQVSLDGGAEPRWSPDGRQIYFRNGPRMMAAAVYTQASFRADKPQVLFDNVSEERPDGDLLYALSADGTRFLMMRSTQANARATRLQVAMNWDGGLARR